jgi:hypothetical protein
VSRCDALDLTVTSAVTSLADLADDIKAKRPRACDRARRGSKTLIDGRNQLRAWTASNIASMIIAATEIQLEPRDLF